MRTRCVRAIPPFPEVPACSARLRNRVLGSREHTECDPKPPSRGREALVHRTHFCTENSSGVWNVYFEEMKKK